MCNTEKGKQSTVRKGFTLIELLIVVAIIAILAAIAIPNFMLGQSRAKIARMQAGLRTDATAMESYYVDYNNYPLYDVMSSTADDFPLSYHLTTPVAYITSLTVDVFNRIRPNAEGRQKYVRYLTEDYSPGAVFSKLTSSDAGISPSNAANGKWILWSLGPDQRDSGDGRNFYDPTNGIISNGDLVRWGP